MAPNKKEMVATLIPQKDEQSHHRTSSESKGLLRLSRRPKNRTAHVLFAELRFGFHQSAEDIQNSDGTIPSQVLFKGWLK